jgi:tetratricopeptide (TPR) repeat protein
MALDNYLELMRLKKQYDQLIAYASQYVDSDMAFVAFSAMADAKAELGDKTKAFEYYNKALLKTGSDDNVVFNILKKMTDAVGRDETIKWCTEQLKATPDSLPINLAMCNLMRSNNETGKALLYIDKCLKLAEQKPSLHRNFTDTKQAILLEAYKATSDDKYFKDAVKLYEDFIAKSPSVEAGALNNLAYLLASNDRDIDKAVEYASKAYDVVQNNPNILDTYSYVLYKKGDYKKASQLVRSAKDMFERTSVSAPPEVYEHLGMISAKLGDKAEAVNAYKQALKVGEKTLSDEQKKRITAAIEALK